METNAAEYGLDPDGPRPQPDECEADRASVEPHGDAADLRAVGVQTFRMNLQDIEARANPLPKQNWVNQPGTCLCGSSMAEEPELSPSCG
jgi:hypothetical protein